MILKQAGKKWNFIRQGIINVVYDNLNFFSYYATTYMKKMKKSQCIQKNMRNQLRFTKTTNIDIVKAHRSPSKEAKMNAYKFYGSHLERNTIWGQISNKGPIVYDKATLKLETRRQAFFCITCWKCHRSNEETDENIFLLIWMWCFGTINNRWEHIFIDMDVMFWHNK